MGLISRVQAAEGFVFASQWERRERYTVVIEGVITQIHALSTMWSVPSPPPPTSANVIESINSTGTVFGVGTININSRGTGDRRYPPSPYTFPRRYIRACSSFPASFGVRAVIPSGSGDGIHVLMGEI